VAAGPEWGPSSGASARGPGPSLGGSLSRQGFLVVELKPRGGGRSEGALVHQGSRRSRAPDPQGACGRSIAFVGGARGSSNRGLPLSQSGLHLLNRQRAEQPSCRAPAGWCGEGPGGWSGRTGSMATPLQAPQRSTVRESSGRCQPSEVQRDQFAITLKAPVPGTSLRAACVGPCLAGLGSAGMMVGIANF